MKKLSFVNKALFFINNIFAILLLLSFFVPYIKPSSFSIAPIIGLATPALIITNAIFVIYWIIIGFKKQFILSAFVLILGFFLSTPIYKFSSKDDVKNENQLTIMSYNVRKFNMYKWIDDENIPKKISEFIAKENPDIVALQEFKENKNFNLEYPYHYNYSSYNWNKNFIHKSGLAFFSKYPIVGKGIVHFKEKIFTSIVYIDVVKGNDTVRLYNFHLESLGLVPGEENFGHKDSEGLIKRLSASFKVQQREIDSLNSNILNNKRTSILVGDMNNTAYSWAYKNLKRNLKDSFLKAGNGFGKTYNFKGFPLRIDYIFVDNNLEILQHKNYKVNYSDHYPIMATISF